MSGTREREIEEQEEERRREDPGRVGAAPVEPRVEEPADHDPREVEDEDERVAVDGAADVHREEAVPQHLEPEGDEAGEEEGREEAAARGDGRGCAPLGPLAHRRDRARDRLGRRRAARRVPRDGGDREVRGAAREQRAAEPERREERVGQGEGADGRAEGVRRVEKGDVPARRAPRGE